ncbi:MAG TPA: 4-(cytidine 5'-diphospho)-2-C-methyl-D-erythritol kinase, partial [Micromonosporaceae bacterium]|nr:4-(cytidine 5'-diphospho)-2-C-methyl-D-erythritol kinase [Micromonosporaceae bacterium]
VPGGTALGTGHGEVVSPVLARPASWHWVVAIADEGLSTPAVYRELDRLREAPNPPAPVGSADALLAALRQRDPAVLGASLGNDLQPAALSLRPALAEVLKAGHTAGALAGLVSGSGPTCVFLAADGGDAERIAGVLEAAGVCRAAWTAHGPVAGARVV